MSDTFFRVEYRSMEYLFDTVDMCYEKTLQDAINSVQSLVKTFPETNHKYCIWEEGWGLDYDDSEIIMEFDHFGNKIPGELKDLGWDYGEDGHPRLLGPEDEDCPICAENRAKEIENYEENV